MTTALPKDRKGHPVRVGTRVRLIKLSDSFLASLPPDEIDDVRSMIGEIFVVDEIDKNGFPWVGKGWPDPEAGYYHGHSLSLDADEMEVVNEQTL